MAKKVRTVLPTAFAENGKLINVIVETPRRCRNKFKYDEKLGLFRLNSVLPAGAAFPYDFGFVPRTKAADGDPIDVLLLMDEPAFTQWFCRLPAWQGRQTANGPTAARGPACCPAECAAEAWSW
ncbi:MAG TPA: inorganic diphosphatase [Planctomycetaceae bacterium]|jgi:inorganic pyrophosphatase|nr:inorganic diphosphatase [Planctomycetaceae bacterium]